MLSLPLLYITINDKEYLFFKASAHCCSAWKWGDGKEANTTNGLGWTQSRSLQQAAAGLWFNNFWEEVGGDVICVHYSRRYIVSKWHICYFKLPLYILCKVNVLGPVMRTKFQCLLFSLLNRFINSKASIFFYYVCMCDFSLPDKSTTQLC